MENNYDVGYDIKNRQTREEMNRTAKAREKGGMPREICRLPDSHFLTPSFAAFGLPTHDSQ